MKPPGCRCFMCSRGTSPAAVLAWVGGAIGVGLVLLVLALAGVGE